MKKIAKALVERTASNNVAWLAYRTCGRLADYFGRVYGHARFARREVEREEATKRIARELFPTLTVVTGPFRGMKYPSLRAVGSALLPKLLGSYESELHSALELMLARNYSTIVDIGCAEGYYAVGLALRLPAAEVFAFDTDARGREACAEMAMLNSVDVRVHIGSLCDANVLRSLPLGSRALIVVDCEGYEKALFSSGLLDVLVKHDLIIEVHDFIDITISYHLKGIFGRTHHVQSIKSKDDIEKAHSYRYEQLEKYDPNERLLILAERRPAIMEWLIATSLATPPGRGRVLVR